MNQLSYWWKIKCNILTLDKIKRTKQKLFAALNKNFNFCKYKRTKLKATMSTNILISNMIKWISVMKKELIFV